MSGSRQHLAALGCDQGQGYFMSRPIPGDKLVDWIRNWVPPLRSALPYAGTAGASATSDTSDTSDSSDTVS